MTDLEVTYLSRENSLSACGGKIALNLDPIAANGRLLHLVAFLLLFRIDENCFWRRIGNRFRNDDCFQTFHSFFCGNNESENEECKISQCKVKKYLLN